MIKLSFLSPNNRQIVLILEIKFNERYEHFNTIWEGISSTNTTSLINLIDLSLKISKQKVKNHFIFTSNQYIILIKKLKSKM